MLTASLLPLSFCFFVSARLHHSRVPEDPFAFPKYRVSFLNGLPLLNQTAERWLHEGLRGGEPEFLDQPWRESSWPANPLKSIQAANDGPATTDVASSKDANYTLQQMKYGPKSSYLCLIPPPPQQVPVVEEAPTEITTPVHSWSLLQPLSGMCLYHRQGWFTYSYCHNSHVRQFHELHHQHVPTTGEYKPEEDPEWEAYTLGRAPPTLETGAELTTAEAAAAANLELARGAGSRYLVQRWGDGTYCDKIGRKREVEIQFHCSMTMTDTILFVKETQTCHYVLHIATPRLCGEPGFKSRIDAEEEHFIRCREVLSADEFERVDRSLPPAAYPFKRPKPQKKVIAPPPPTPEGAKKDKADANKGSADAGPRSEVLRKALQRLLARQDGAQVGDSHYVIERGPDGEAEMLVEYIDIDLEDVADDFHLDEDFRSRLQEILRGAESDLAGGGQAAGTAPNSRRQEPKDVDEADAQEDNNDKADKTNANAKKHRDEL